MSKQIIGFLLLTPTWSDEPLAVPIDNIAIIAPRDEGGSFLHLKSGGPHYTVKETPAKIREILNSLFYEEGTPP